MKKRILTSILAGTFIASSLALNDNYKLNQKEADNFVNFFYKDNLKIDFLDDITFRDEISEKGEIFRNELIDKYRDQKLTKQDLRNIAIYLNENLTQQ